MPLVFTLAFRNLFHDRLRLIATVIGIVFSIVLVMVQMGLYFGFGRMVTTMIDNASADLWVMPKGTKCFEDPSLLDSRDRNRALSVPSVAEAIPLVIGFADWRTPAGSSTPVFVVGSDLRSGGLEPWNLVEGRLESLSTPNSVAVDKTYFNRLGISGLGSRAEIRQQAVRVAAVTSGIRSLTTTPYVFMDVDRARSYTGTPSSKATYFLIRLDQNSQLSTVRSHLQATLGPEVEVLTPPEFRERSRSFWLFGTGAGAALFAGAILGIIVGTVIVAQTLYSSTKDHINEFATLRAMGSSRAYIYKVIIWQAILNAVIGFSLAALVGAAVVRATAASALPIVITPELSVGLFVLTLVMCIISAIAAIMKVTRIDPAQVFTR
jgi:putative ABC transport system permease protein